MIPKLIHQTWKTKNVASYGKGKMGIWSQNSLLRDYSDCEYKVWSDEELAELIETEFEYIRDIYNKVSKIKKSDIGRLAVVKKFGGLYFDLDVISHERIPNVFEDYEYITSWAWKRKKSRSITNHFFGSVPNHPLVEETLKSIASEEDLSMNTLKHTGPVRLNRICNKMNMWDDIHVLSKDEFVNYRRHSKRVAKYATHYMKHQW
jgi:mannosyltransferase OCH1-like enzyme